MHAAIDIALAACLVAVMACALVQEAPHEYLGLAAFALAVAHTVVNRRRIVALVRGKKSTRTIATLVVDALLAACVLAMAWSALVLSKHALGFLPALPGAALARRVHLGCSYWLFAAVAVHAGMHVRIGRPVRGRSPAVKVAFGIASAALFALGAWSFVELDYGSYLLLQVQFAFVDETKPLALSALQFALAGAALALAASAITVLSSKPGKIGERK